MQLKRNSEKISPKGLTAPASRSTLVAWETVAAYKVAGGRGQDEVLAGVDCLWRYRTVSSRLLGDDSAKESRFVTGGSSQKPAFL
ncbi:MAG: hypothetical protein KME26_06620 [Oscillatoria princeps RMCB-10]|nr:hypothetical protein [Oscillatoria princeps RMCB-10]